ncbi:formylglycine-generating enzyme family protein [Desulfobacca acetoxidans]|uniref:Sulphatase-modifying factor protein n=1 Tax=Desulfobacca acetoxidans (strain ATCC 700848 / DSM 11109 / ASRB2) TaxID=880072 RepID=F2NIB1_DESAR|nr:formylglycine-generating enzyme family protein [Desulfobacca acetoxidans]AEB09880.1 Sulphatase-modifying factor protein [Desulfobacca acetoxidans DSM 11109]
MSDSHLQDSMIAQRLFLCLIICFCLSAWLASGRLALAASPPPAPTCHNILGIQLRLIPGGPYLLGSPPEESGRYWDEGPQHWVNLSPFYITATEITNAQYGEFLAATGHPEPLYWLDRNLNAPNQPVVGVTWHDATAFAKWLSRITQEEYMLPTEAQWEAAARGGLVGQPFPWGSTPPEQGGRFRASFNPNPYDKDGFRYTAPVASFPPNGFGLYDMAGNVAEWCEDWYHSSSYTKSRKENPAGPASGTSRVLRGGSWYGRARELRCAARQSFRPSQTDGFIGFRLIRPVSP